MSYDPLFHHRRSIRLDGYDYSKPGFYFVTNIVKDRNPLLGEISDGKMNLSELGKMVHERWFQIQEYYPNVRLLEFVILPDHIHGIIEIKGDELNSDSADIESIFQMRSWKENFIDQTDTNFKSPSKTIGAIIRGFKFGVTSDYKKKTGKPTKLFQRDYYEEIIKDYGHFIMVRNYIRNNIKNYKNSK
ncbi:MAG: transposase [Bacteroidetes bacterium]|nr:transposase [Bacteroidota bacterium]